MNIFNMLLKNGINKKTPNIAVAVAHDLDVIRAVCDAKSKQLTNAILIGNAKEILSIAEENDLDIVDFPIIDVVDEDKACQEAVRLIRNGEAEILMKGFVNTDVLLRAVLNKKLGIKKRDILSHVALFHPENYHKPFLLADAGMNISPNIEEKRGIICNTVSLALSLSISNPKVALLAATEKINDKMPATMEAKALTEMNLRGEIEGCIIGGPFALDNAISKDAARHKRILHPVSGDADILIVPNIEAGNILYKSLIYFAKADCAGLVLGASAPIVLTSRADSPKIKLNSIALSIFIAKVN